MDRRGASWLPPQPPAGPAVGMVLSVAVLCGVVAASFTLAAGLDSLGAIILVFLAQLPLFIAGLWLGFRAALLAGMAAALVLLAMGPWREALLFALSSAGPAIFLVRQALLQRRSGAGRQEWYPLGRLAAWLAGFGLLALALVVLALGGPYGIEQTLHRTLGPVLRRLPDVSAGGRARITDLVAAVIPGATAASWMVMTVTNAALAQGVLGRFGASLRPAPDLATLTLPLWLAALFAAAAGATALGATGRFLGVNVMIVLAVPLCLAGLGVLHSFVRAFSRPAMLLTVFYVFAGLFGWPLIFAALLGLIDAPLGLRRRLQRSRSGEGEIDG
jgi:Predicted membrane protein (DUF2232)